MEITFAHLCHEAGFGEEGFNVGGIFDGIRVSMLPVMLPPLKLAFGLEVPLSEEGQAIGLRFQIADPGGAAVYADEVSLTATIDPGAHRTTAYKVLPIPPIRISNPGIHTVDFWVNGALVDRTITSMEAVLVPPAGTRWK